ncbi:MAG TPA: aminotransferase class IV [Thermoanaerobaculia bacterium]|nr:aminotransferase class IV [Thermoanaerobaculia bacterium]
MIDELGLFETMRVVHGRVVELEEHLERMLASSRALSFPLPDAIAFRKAAERAAKRVATLKEAALRCMWVAERGTVWTLTATSSPISETTLRRRRRGRAITLAHSRALPEHKLTSYAPSIIGLREAIAKNADEGLFLDRDGRVLEGTATNVFAVDADRLITAPDNILPGIVRAWLLANAEVVLRAPTIEELRAGSFFTSSLTTLAPIRFIDGRACRAPGRIFTELRRRYLRQ